MYVRQQCAGSVGPKTNAVGSRHRGGGGEKIYVSMYGMWLFADKKLLQIEPTFFPQELRGAFSFSSPERKKDHTCEHRRERRAVPCRVVKLR